MECSIGIDLGGTKILGAIVDTQGSVIERLTVPTPVTGSEDILRSIEELILQLRNHSMKRKWKLKGVGVGTAGQVDFNKGHVLPGTTNIAGWNDVSVREILQERTGCQVWVDNDVNTFTLAEARLGSAAGNNSIICLAFGTGVGGGIMIDGKLLRGAWGGACELGHICVDMNGPVCNCGSQGCLETFASGAWLPIRMKERVCSRPIVCGGALEEAPETSEEVFRRYLCGDKCAGETVSEMIRAISVGIVSLIHTFNPTVVVIGGGMIDRNQWILSEVTKQTEMIGIRSLVDPVSFQLSHFGADACVIGAALQNWLYD